MIFTKLCRIVAFLAIVSGIILVGMGAILATSNEPGTDLSPIIGRRSTGQVIDRGFYIILVGIVLGTLSDISRALQSKLG
ncbi:MAG: hypothetical protein B7Z02_02440 [Rhodobacterales bacterium 32-67-9]|nr:MAG: hypothetical protein B7Z02_02440 [Rhodobacterales bacterium 32-67-9]